MRGLTGLPLALLLAAGVAHGQPVRPRQDPVLGSWISEGLLQGDRLFVRGVHWTNSGAGYRASPGGLAVIDLGAEVRTDLFSEGVVDIANTPQGLRLLREADSSRLVIESLGPGVGARVGEVSLESGELALGLGAAGGRLLVLTSKAMRILDPVTGRWEASPVEVGHATGRRQMPTGVVASADGRWLYTGSDEGEFGGDLRAIEVSTGRVSVPVGDNVTAIKQDRERPGCVLVTTALNHLVTVKGALWRVCGTNAERLLVLPPPPAEGSPFFAPTETPFYGLAVGSATTLLALQGGRNLRLTDGSAHTVLARPQMREIGGVPMGRVDGDTLVLAYSWANYDGREDRFVPVLAGRD